MWLVFGMLCAAGFACEWYPMGMNPATSERACMAVVVRHFNEADSLEPYAAVQCKYRPKSPRRME